MTNRPFSLIVPNMKDIDLDQLLEEFAVSGCLLSVCCRAPALGELSEGPDGISIGLCSRCRDHTTFDQEPEDER